MGSTVLEKNALAKTARTGKTAARAAEDARVAEIARGLALMDELEELVQSLPDRRAEAGLGPLPDDAVALSYAEHEAQLL